MAECHPVGFQWVMEAKARGAKVIHIDPRFTRTSAVADPHVPLRAGSDIAFLGGIINYILSNEKYFRDYVVAYTNAATLISEDFQDVDELDGLFSGYDPETGHLRPAAGPTRATRSRGRRQRGRRDRQQARRPERPGQRRRRPTSAPGGSGRRRGGDEPESEKDRAAGTSSAAAARASSTARSSATRRCSTRARSSRCSSATTPATRPRSCEQICGVPPEQFLQVCEDVTANSGRDRTTAWVYSVGWTHHSVGVQYIRGSAIIQLLLGNMGRPGGGILALRGHASIQGSTDIPTLFNILPGYLPMPKAGAHDSYADYLDGIAKPGMKGFWTKADAYTASLLKAWWGDAATPENDFCFDYLPRLTGDHGTYQTVFDMNDGKVDGYFLLGQNPAVGSAHGKLQRLGMAKLKWLVVRDLQMIESATFWKDGPEIETGELKTEEIGTEVFFFPAATHTEKEGTFTQTQRMLQWRYKAVEPPGDGRSELHFFYHLGRLLRERYAGLDRGARTGRCSTSPGTTRPTASTEDPDAEAVLQEINGSLPHR